MIKHIAANRLRDHILEVQSVLEGLSFQDRINIIQRLVDTLQEFMGVATWVAGYVASDPVVMDTVSNTKAVRYYGGKAPKVHSWTGKGTSRKDVVVNGCVGRVCVEVGQGPALRASQVPQGKQVAIKSLTC